MLRTSTARLFITKVMKVAKPPATGYEIAELPNEKVLAEFMQFYRTKGVLVILHSGDLTSAGAASSASIGSLSSSSSSGVNEAKVQKSPIAQDPVTRSFISSINAMNLGNPEEVKLALVPGPQAPRLVDEYNILTYPTTLMFLDGKCVYRNVGARTRELSIKSLFMLRNGGRNVFSRE